MKELTLYKRIEEFKKNLMTQSLFNIISTTIERDLAKHLLMNNDSIIVNGTVKHFDIKPIGLGVFIVTLDTSVPPRKYNLLLKK